MLHVLYVAGCQRGQGFRHRVAGLADGGADSAGQPHGVRVSGETPSTRVSFTHFPQVFLLPLPIISL